MLGPGFLLFERARRLQKVYNVEDVSVEEVRRLLSYDPETGEITRNTACGKLPAGRKSGYLGKNGYLVVMIKGTKRCYVHHLAWIITYGEWPTLKVDHIDRDKTNNKLNNLREVTDTQNSQNVTVARSDSESGVRGVSMRKDMVFPKWTAKIHINGKTKRLGTFDSAEDAEVAYLEAKAVLHPAWSPN